MVTSRAYLNPAAPHLGSSDSTDPLKPYQLGVGKVLLETLERNGEDLLSYQNWCENFNSDISL